MRNPFNKKWLAATLCTLVLGSTVARAEIDSFGLGSGRNGALTVTTAGRTVNSYAQVTGPLAPGDTSLPVGTCLGESACFAAGDLVMVFQTTGRVPEPASGEPGPLDLSNSNEAVGRWEFARLASVSGSTLTLTAPLVHSYAANVTQVIRVPEYTSVSLTSTGRITALPWNGSVGGIIAFLASGTVSNAGQINANAAGFRGGQFIDDDSGTLGCSGLDEASAQGAQKGEGIAVTRYGATQTGRGNVANGAGGGVCFKSGGGGGGNYGAGGVGGRSDGSIDGARLVGGLGGAALVYSPLNRLTPGGGGAAGHGADNSGAPGGRGGGIIFIRANQLTGTGTIQASGGSGGSTASDGGSGGGAGGSMYLRFVGTAACGSVSVNGGVGGTANTGQVGPGGGGGGGRVLFQAATGGTCNINLIGAAPGNQQDPTAPDGTAYGARPGTNGVPTLLSGGFVVLPTPTVVSPAEGRFISNRRPVISGSARPNTTVIIYVDGVEAGRVTSDAAGNYSFTPTTDLPEGSRKVQVAVELDAVQSPRSSERAFTVDVTAPDTRFVSTPPSTTNATSATFQFAYEGTEPGSVTYQCKLDTEADFTACSNPRTYTDLGAGSHTLFVRAVDAAGNVDPTPARYDWTLDLTPPDTRITAGPPSVTSATSATFQFTHEGTEPPTVTYQCKLATETAFSSCSSPRTYTGLADGTYTFQVRAVDAVGNPDPTPATQTWTVDTSRPTVSIVSGPTGTTKDTSATFDFDSNEAGTTPGVTYLCKLDTEADFTPCPDPKTYTGLGEGGHRLEVIAEDAAGNRSETPAVRTWTVDITAPDTKIVSGPPSSTSATSATFQFAHEGTESGTVKYQCKLDTEADFTDCTNPKTYTGLGEGAHTLLVRAVDAVGNVDTTPARYDWAVDTTPPDTKIVSGPQSRTSSSSAMFQFTHEGTETGTVTYQCKLETEADFTSCSSPKTYMDLTDGTYTFLVRAVDAAGNPDPTPATQTWTVDTSKPTVSIVSGPPSTTSSTSATFDFDSNEASSPTGVTYLCKLDGEADFTVCSDPKTYTGLGEGAHRLEVLAMDAAGNRSETPAVYTWLVDTLAPDTRIDSGPPSRTNATSATFQFTHVGTEMGTVTYQCKLETETVFSSCSSPRTYTGLADGTYTFLVRAVDAAGNVDPTPATQSWTVDTSKPTVSIVSGPTGTTRDTTATFDFDSNEAGTTPGVTYLCKLDGEVDFTPCPDPKTYTGLGEGGHRLEVIAEDAAGNRSETPAVRTWTVDTTAPDTRIVSGPTGLTNATSATFEFEEVTPTPGTTFQCKLDTEADFTPCSSPRTYTGLGQGEHTLLVRAVDAAGNVDATPASRTWTVDTVAPAVPVVSAPANGATLDTLTPAITGTAEPGSTVTLIIDGQVAGTAKADASGNWSYTPTTPLTVGSHEVKVRTTDEAGNTSPESPGRTFTIVQDTKAPETTIVSGPSGTTPAREATFELGSNEPGVTYECSLDGAAFTPCTSPVTYTHLGEGEHTFQVRARDAAGNVEATPETRTWTIQDETKGGDISFRGDGFGCSATGGDASLVLMGLGTFLALARRRRR